MLMYYDTVSADRDISFTAEALLPSELPLSSVELVNIISNLLDNSFDACERVPEGKKMVTIAISYKENAFTCVCKNSFDGKVVKKGKNFVSQKTDTNNHGYGTQILTETANRHGGKCEFDYNENTFSATVYISFNKI